MANNTLDTEIQSRLSSFLDELSQLVKRQALEAVQEALGDTTSPNRGPGRARNVTMSTTRKPRAIAKSSVRGTRIRRSAADLDAISTQVLAQVRSNPGQRLEEIGRALRTNTAVLKKPVAKLLAAKKLRTTGAKRGTKYFTR